MRVRLLKVAIAAAFADHIFSAPSVLWLKHIDVDPARDELADHSSKKMSISVIPIRDKRVIKHRNFHDRSPVSLNAITKPYAFVASLASETNKFRSSACPCFPRSTDVLARSPAFASSREARGLRSTSAKQPYR